MVSMCGPCFSTSIVSYFAALPGEKGLRILPEDCTLALHLDLSCSHTPPMSIHFNSVRCGYVHSCGPCQCPSGSPSMAGVVSSTKEGGPCIKEGGSIAVHKETNASGGHKTVISPPPHTRGQPPQS
uniref:Uncharacterized protein n=1 Tax=Eutreptiella gymnastica TaxID=73025 RepID=A0A7S1IS14_9EUGL|mmetsp:Transcript_38334/g.68499  ORF Transcript_38334/g.68499 Transcript_38334/m.68499 type:complete len:126 (+) Transcript_38334:798-1175(+)